MPLFEALKARHSTRVYEPYPLPFGTLSNLLWCAWGINRPATGERTAPSWRHSSEIDVYVFTAEGVWFYDGRARRLLPRLAGDHRAQTVGIPKAQPDRALRPPSSRLRYRFGH